MDPRFSRPESASAAALRCCAEGDFASALAAVERAFASAPGPDERNALGGALGEIARAAEAAGDLDLAERALVHATREFEWADLDCRLGALLARRGRRAEARAALDRALARNPRFRQAAVERALLDARDGRIGEAVAALRTLAASGPLAEPTAFQRGLDQLGRAAFDDAAPLLRRALRGGDTWLDGQLARYQERMAAGDTAGACALLRDAAVERPDYPDLLLLLGGHERLSGALDDAVETLTRALELNPDFHAARVEAARAFEVLGDTPLALRQLELVLDHEPGHEAAGELYRRLAARHIGARDNARTN